MTFPKFAKFGLTVSLVALLYELFRIIRGPHGLVNMIFTILGLLAAIVGILYFGNELKKEE
jgi:hypothetical protein